MILTKEDTLHAKGIAIIAMLMLHLFCRLGELPYMPLIWIGGTPLIYYLGLFGDICVPIYCFCAGYTHYLLQNKDQEKYVQQIPNKILRFLVNYWIIVVLFALVGLLFDSTGKIPGSFGTFIGNILVVGMSYNGAWWFVATYLFLLTLSPLEIFLTKKIPAFLLLLCSGAFYLSAYMFRYNFILEIHNPVLNWAWHQIILFGMSQLPYFMGMLAFKMEIPQKAREYLAVQEKSAFKRMLIIGLPLMAFLGHCIVQSMVVAPFTAMAVLISLFLIKLPAWLDHFLSFLGKHSTNIWFTHMFFYLTLFKGFVFHAKYPILIIVFMFTICILISMLINAIYQPIKKRIDLLL